MNQNMRGVFHMFKNTLFTIDVMIKQLRMENPELPEETTAELGDYVKNSLSSMTAMLDACKSIDMAVEKYSLCAVLDNVLERAAVPAHITVRKSYLCADIPIVMDRFHLENALLNIVNNAVDAVEMRGEQKGWIELIMRY